MKVEKFLSHLYRNIWIYIIKCKKYNIHWTNSGNDDYDPEDFYSDEIPELIKNLKSNFPFQEAYEEVIGSIDLTIRDIIVNFMSWFSYIEDFDAVTVLNELIYNSRPGVEPLNKLVSCHS